MGQVFDWFLPNTPFDEYVVLALVDEREDGTEEQAWTGRVSAIKHAVKKLENKHERAFEELTKKIEELTKNTKKIEEVLTNQGELTKKMEQAFRKLQEKKR